MALSGKKTVGDITVAQFHAGIDRLVVISYVVVVFVFRFDVVQDLDGFIHAWRVDHYFLKTAVECTVFLNVHAVFIERRSADALQFATGKGWFEYIACIE